MKYLLFLCFLMIFAQYSWAQDVVLLPKDETGKYTYYEVVKSTIKDDSLKMRLLSFLANNRKEIKLRTTSDGKLITANGKLIIQKSLAVISHPSGEINYQFNFETGDGKYRFWLTDFEFIPYQKDRYGNFVPSTTVGIPLEKEPKKSAADQWQDYLQQSSAYAANFAVRLKDYLINKAIPLPSPAEKKVISKTW
ncbi:DUF4468 domain-containing protein [Pedobacter xixiisoli]|uniref:DUF4468 domain-containing protein n=1 Tax=Pedobacter xixiisoli TaxID=1476464 RepID=A0A285ZY88_9SPHI|nr:DUF4468 domain-containing protein [Pedobacter xixiisoli]SOD14577.1 protein of unknown function [Pedobacter xixiisoli]